MDKILREKKIQLKGLFSENFFFSEIKPMGVQYID